MIYDLWMDPGSLSSLFDLLSHKQFLQRILLVVPVFLWLISPGLFANFEEPIDGRPKFGDLRSNGFFPHRNDTFLSFNFLFERC